MEFEGATPLGVPGWVEIRLSGGDDPPRLLVKVEERGGRWVVGRLVLAGERVDSTTLRAIPIGRVESLLNPPPAGVLSPPEPHHLAELAARGHMFPEEIGAIDEALSAFLRKKPVAPSGVQVKGRRTRRKPLTRPDGTDPEGFSQRVAAAYREAIETTGAPAPLLAAEADVPVVTVHRWIADARRRGFLPPARQGRAG